MSVPLSDVVFAFDFDRLTSDGNLYDYGPLGLHGTIVGPTRQLGGRYYFNGAAERITLDGPRFYANAPVSEWTMLSVHQQVSSATTALFSALNAAATRGIEFLGVANAAPAYILTQSCDPTLRTRSYVSSTVGTNRTAWVAVATDSATGRGIIHQTYVSATAVGVLGTIQYDTAVVPTIGNRPGVGLSGLWYAHYMCLIRGAISSPDLSQLSRMLSEGLRPFCQRGA